MVTLLLILLVCMNKEAVGRAIKDYLKESGTSRDKLFITT